MMNKITLYLWLPSVFLIIFISTVSSCKNVAGEPTGRLTRQSSCKQFPAGPATAFVPANDQECIHYRYSGDTLYISHLNTAFNCCPGEISISVTVSDHTITIRESEKTAGCHCMCLFDLEMEINELPIGIYRIALAAPYVGDQPNADFICDLARKPEGDYCVDRNGYPWALPAK
jgi:hypothetical protein